MPKAIRKYTSYKLRAKRLPTFQKGGAVAEEETPVAATYADMMNHTISKKGGKAADYIELMNAIAYHETGPQQCMSPTAVQLVMKDGKLQPIGVGRGRFMFEVGDDRAGIIAVNRTVKELKDNDMVVPDWLAELYKGKSADFSKLTEEQQNFLFLGNYLQHPKANFGNYINGNETAEDFWLNYHQAGGADVANERRLAWQASMADREKKKKKKP
jgi:hypothetical protein